MRSLFAILLLLSPAYAGAPLILSESAAILHYNAPAAVSDGETVFAGWIGGDGGVEIARIDRHQLTAKAAVHKYDGPDDHAAPALALKDDRLIVATSHHITDLFVYSVDRNTLAQELLCHVPGRFTYPRLLSSPEGHLLLFIREQTDKAGHLSKITIDAGCTKPEVVITANEREYIYAAPPGYFDSKVWLAWSVYSELTKRHDGVYATVLGSEQVFTIRAPKGDGYPEVLASAIGKEGISYVRFSGDMACCDNGAMGITLADLSGRVITETLPSRIPYYPTLSQAPCTTGYLPFLSQSFPGGYIASEIKSRRHRLRAFDSTVFLCFSRDRRF